MSRSLAAVRRLAIAGALTGAAPLPLRAQIQPETQLDSRGYATTMIQNRGTEVVDVTVELRHGSVTREKVELGEPVNALVSPAAFVLGPGETQTIRILVRDTLPPAGVVRLVTTITPRAPAPPGPAAPPAGAQAHLTFATRLITKVVAE